MGKVRIFQFPIRNSYGGITHYAINNWRYLDKERFSCDFGTISRHLDFEDEIRSSGAGLRYISCYAEEDKERFSEEIYNTLRSGGYDAVHLHTSFWKSFLVEEIARDCGIPKVIVHSHSTMVDIEDPATRQAAERVHWEKRAQFCMDLATDFWACSQMAADWLFGGQIPKERIVIMKDAIEVEPFLFNPLVRREYRDRLELEDCFVIGHVGRFCYQKNQEFLVRVFAEVRRKRENARLLLVGAGETMSRVLRLAEELGVDGSVLFLGRRGDVPQLMQAMDVFCLPSRFEGLGLVLIEAQSAGLKCFASSVVPDEAAITDNASFLPLEEPRWVDAVLACSEDYERKDQCREITDSGYNITQQIREIERCYLK